MEGFHMDPEVKDLVLKVVDSNPGWGAPKIHGELLKLGLVTFERTVSGFYADIGENHRHRLAIPSSRTI